MNKFFSLVLAFTFWAGPSVVGETSDSRFVPPCWWHLTVEENPNTWVRLDFRIHEGMQYTMARDLWVNLTDARLSSDSIVEVDLSVVHPTSENQESPKPVVLQTQQLAYVPSDRKYTWMMSPLMISSEGRTGGDTSDRFFITIRVRKSNGEHLVLVDSKPLDFRNRRQN